MRVLLYTVYNPHRIVCPSFSFPIVSEVQLYPHVVKMPVHDAEEMFNLKTPSDEVLIALPPLTPTSGNLGVPPCFARSLSRNLVRCAPFIYLYISIPR